MYHDQGLPVLKHAGFGHAVNVTLGLPYVRTSVDHGTALDLAGTGKADAGSLIAATRLALDLAAETRGDGTYVSRRAPANARATGQPIPAPRHQETLRPAFPARSRHPAPASCRRSRRSRGDNVVEIGPGDGALTLPLLRALGRLTVIELDRDLVPRLRAPRKASASSRSSTRTC